MSIPRVGVVCEFIAKAPTLSEEELGRLREGVRGSVEDVHLRQAMRPAMTILRPHVRRIRSMRGSASHRHLHALGELVDHVFPDPSHLFDHGLALLVQQLGMESAVMSRLTELGWEAFWWATAKGVHPDLAIHEPANTFCPYVLKNAGRTLMIRDASLDPEWKEHYASRALGLRAYLGASLNLSGEAMGVLSVSSRHPKAFTRAEIAMVKSLANLFGKTLEVEQLKHDLQVTRDALDLTAAVVEDSALKAARSRLPNAHYLDIWLKANFYLARRRGEVMAVARWRTSFSGESKKALLDIFESLRGEDLLVDLGHDDFLLLLPHTPREGAQILLDRIRKRLGSVCMGATLWNPSQNADRNDLMIRNAIRRAFLGMQRSQELATDRGSDVVWDVLFVNTEGLVDA